MSIETNCEVLSKWSKAKIIINFSTFTLLTSARDLQKKNCDCMIFIALMRPYGLSQTRAELNDDSDLISAGKGGSWCERIKIHLLKSNVEEKKGFKNLSLRTLVKYTEY